jgi:hypothetical protein
MFWKIWLLVNSIRDVAIWWKLLTHDKMKALPDKEYENVFLDRWSHVGKRDKESTKCLFSCTHFLLQFNGCI